MNWINIAESTTATLIAGGVTALAGGIYAAVKVKPTRRKNGYSKDGTSNVNQSIGNVYGNNNQMLNHHGDGPITQVSGNNNHVDQSTNVTHHNHNSPQKTPDDDAENILMMVVIPILVAALFLVSWPVVNAILVVALAIVAILSITIIVMGKKSKTMNGIATSRFFWFPLEVVALSALLALSLVSMNTPGNQWNFASMRQRVWESINAAQGQHVSVVDIVTSIGKLYGPQGYFVVLLYLLAVVMMSLALLKAFLPLVNSYAVLYHHKPRTVNHREYCRSALIVLVPSLIAICLAQDWAITWIVESYARLTGLG